MAAISLEQIVGAESLKRLKFPTAKAKPLPNIIYTSEDFARLENERLFPRVWVHAGYAHELRDPGDLVPVRVAARPILLVKNHEGEIKAFYNSCRHRGTQLVSERCRRRKEIRCPFHSWTYDLDGNLTKATNFLGKGKHHLHETELSDLPLAPVRVDRWHDWIFVNLDGKVPPLKEYMKPFTDQLVGYDFSLLRHAHTLRLELKCNWKLMQENYTEGYHVLTIHPRLNVFTSGYDHSNILHGPLFGTVIDEVNPESPDKPPLPTFPSPPKGTKFGNQQAKSFETGSNVHALFPHFKFIASPDHVATGVEIPERPDLIHQRWDFYFVGDNAMAPPFEAQRQGILDLYVRTFREDRMILEAVQNGQTSPVNGGAFSETWEGSCHHFQRLVVECIQSKKQPFTGKLRAFKKKTRHGGRTSWGRSI